MLCSETLVGKAFYLVTFLKNWKLNRVWEEMETLLSFCSRWFFGSTRRLSQHHSATVGEGTVPIAFPPLRNALCFFLNFSLYSAQRPCLSRVEKWSMPLSRVALPKLTLEFAMALRNL